MKSRIREIAGELIKIAAESRRLREAPRLVVGPGAYERILRGFSVRRKPTISFAAIDATIRDLGSGRPMDRLICGDVGFGKTEAALRARLHRRQSAANRLRWWCLRRCWHANISKPFQTVSGAFP